MLTLGIDVVVLAMIGLTHLFITFLWCKTADMPEDEAIAMLNGTMMTITIMVFGYVIMVRVLDMLVLYV